MTQLASNGFRLVVVLVAAMLTLSSTLPTAAAQVPAAQQGTPTLDAGPSFVIRPLEGVDGDFFTLEAEAGTTN